MKMRKRRSAILHTMEVAPTIFYPNTVKMLFRWSTDRKHPQFKRKMK